MLHRLFLVAAGVSSVSGILLGNSTNYQTILEQPLVTIRNGTLAGTYNSFYHQDLFLGIPFARPPVGYLRFQNPQPASGWNSTRQATEYGDNCYGNSLMLPGFSQPVPGPMSEDCLTLNIVRPAGTEHPIPVVVWLPGGGRLEGGSRDPRWNGTFMVEESVSLRRPVMFVSINYRLGVFGQLSGSTLKSAGVTNMGFRDQRQALFWIQENIHAFGGDKTRVTIMGESAGAGSVGLHLLAKGGVNEGLFHRAIAQSGGPLPSGPLPNMTRQDSDFALVLRNTNCTGAADPLLCLRRVPAQVLNPLSFLVAAINSVDNDLIPALPSQLLRENSFIKVPLLIGSNRNEGTVFIVNSINNASDLSALITARVSPSSIPPAALSLLLETYQDPAILTASDAGVGTVNPSPPGLQFGALWGSATLFASDYIIAAGRRLAARTWARNNVSCYSYFFDTPTFNVDRTTRGATHAQELPFTFGNQNAIGWELGDPYPSNKAERTKYRALAKSIVRRWIGFVVDGDPNTFNSYDDLEWPNYDLENPRSVQFSATDGDSLQADTWRAAAMDLLANEGLDINR
ncbi:Secreted lipase [Sphaceloma murrayae]|uniref:Carboxylic ester hydrolase n=1 Tax=Sphaceloma murrayae TaxID=2082308 RepID=A0A2K1QSY2_9PEZI|nr:Secreted lipase [Sphaceloma murrayae]